MRRLIDTISATPGLNRETRDALVEGLQSIMEVEGDAVDNLADMMSTGKEIADNIKKVQMRDPEAAAAMTDSTVTKDDDQNDLGESVEVGGPALTEGLISWLFGGKKDPATKLADQTERIFDDLQSYLENLSMREERAAMSNRGIYGYAGGNSISQMSSKIEQARSKMLQAISKIRSAYNSAIKARDKAERVRDSYDNKLNYMRDSRDDYRNRYNEARKSRRR